MTSIISSESLCPTPTILSFGFKLPVFSAGPPAIKEDMDVYNPSEVRRAPMHYKDKRILISKSSVFLGDI